MHKAMWIWSQKILSKTSGENTTSKRCQGLESPVWSVISDSVYPSVLVTLSHPASAFIQMFLSAAYVKHASRYGRSRTTSFFILLALSEEALSSPFTLPPDYQKPSELYSMNTTVGSYQWVLCSKLKEHSLYHSILLLTLCVWLCGGEGYVYKCRCPQRPENARFP